MSILDGALLGAFFGSVASLVALIALWAYEVYE